MNMKISTQLLGVGCELAASDLWVIYDSERSQAIAPPLKRVDKRCDSGPRWFLSDEKNPFCRKLQDEWIVRW